MSSTTPTAAEPAATSGSVSGAVCVYLIVAGVAAAALALLGVFDLETPWELPRGLSGILSATVAVASCGAIVRSAADGVHQRLGRIEQRLDDQGEHGYATGFVDGAAGGRHLTAVNHR